jgi:hypothetical protein
MSKGTDVIDRLIQGFGGYAAGSGKLPPYKLTAYLVGRSFVVLMENEERGGWDIMMPVSNSLSSEKTIEAVTARIKQENK